MKATVEVPDELYRKVKAKSALEGRPVRQVALELFRGWVGESQPPGAAEKLRRTGAKSAPPWVGSLRKYARNAKGRHDMATIRKSIARARAADWAVKERGS
jgi:hypothetical protein